MQSRKRLVLFDIDGTLVSTNGHGRRHFAAALDAVFGIPLAAHNHDFAGKLDTQIYHEILTLAGLGEKEIWEQFDTFAETFSTMMELELNASVVQALPGTKQLLEALSEYSDITMALLTGNLEHCARIKLDIVDFNRYFPFGAFGNDGRRRSELPAIAVERAHQRCGWPFKEKEVVIIGDTPNDIDCGKALAAKSIAVSTGTFSAATLEACQPDYLFHSLEDANAIIEAIFET